MTNINAISLDVQNIDDEDAANAIEIIINKNSKKPYTLGLPEEQARFIAFQISNILQDRVYVREMETREKIKTALTRTQKACQKIYDKGIESKDNGYEL